MPKRLCASPNFALSQSASGKSFVVGEVEPYPQYWLSECERLLFALFGKRGGMSSSDAVKALLQLSGGPDNVPQRSRIERTIAGMRDAGVLIEPAAELSRYGREMAQDYLEHRPFPSSIAARIAALGEIGPQNWVLDLAAGPGSLALELAARSTQVTMMELSRGFVAAAKAEAKRRGVQIETINESCNRLVHMDDEFDVITISQAIHWLDDVLLVKGVCRNLAENGSFFVVHGALTLPPDHPLGYVLGDSTPLGDKPKVPFAEEVRALYRRIALLFDALDAPDVARHDPSHARRGAQRIAGCGIELFRQQRPIGEGFARAFLSDDHIAALGQDRSAFWNDLHGRCEAASAEEIEGVQEFAVLHFRRGAGRLDSDDWVPGSVQEIGFPG